MKKVLPYGFVLRAAVGALFMYSGWTKLMEPSSNFVGVILGYKILDVRAAVWAAAILPWVEWIVGAFLVLGLWTRQALETFGLLCAIFFGAIASTYVRKIPLQDCGCFGQGPKAMPLWGTLILDATLFLTIVFLYWKKEETGRLSLDKALKA